MSALQSPEMNASGRPDRNWEMLASIVASVASVTAKLDSMKEDDAAIRRNLHDLGNRLQPLMGLPEQIKEMRDQHKEMKKQIEDVSGKLALVTGLSERVNKLEPIVTDLVAEKNKTVGAIWAGRVMSALIGALAAVAAYLGFVRHP